MHAAVLGWHLNPVVLAASADPKTARGRAPQSTTQFDLQFRLVQRAAHVAEVRGSRQSLSKPREKSDDGASEKLLSKEIEARIVTQENMADAKYVVGDIRNGDAKVEIDSNKRTFTGLSKEELLKYQDDPFWVRLRWTMFVLFWALWVGMLVGAIAIIVQSPKCTAPQARKWYEEGPLVELEEASSFHTIEEGLPRLKEAHVKGVYVPSTLAGDIYDEKLNLTAFQEFVQKAKDAGVKVIVDMTANFVNKSHEWFALSERSEGEYADYFMWAPAKRQDAGQNQPPNNWVSTLDEPAWTWSEQRKAFYLHQYSADTPDLNFSNPRVQDIFYGVMRTWLNAGAAGIRLQKARQLLVNRDLPDDNIGPDGTAYAHTEYAYYSHRPTSDRPELRALLQRWRKATEELDSDFVLSMRESVPAREPYLARDVMDGNRTTSALPLPAAGAVSVTESAQRLSTHLNRLIRYWPAVQLTSDSETADEAALLSLMLPAAPILTRDQKFTVDNTTWKVNPTYEHMVGLRSQPVIMHGHYNITSFAHGTLLGITRWMSGGAGYAAVYNPSAATVLGDATELPHVPDAVAVEMLSRNYDVPNITRHSNVHGRDLVVSPRSVIVLVFVPVADE